MGGSWSIKCQNLSKKFALNLKRSMIYGLRDSARAIVGLEISRDKLRDGEFWALDDISFQLHQGQALGIMGVNGSGKSTLLRILNGTYRPDLGRVEIRGRMGALIAAGAGFSPLLTGRENVFINGSLLGMSRSELNDRLDEIIDFSGLGDAIDMPVRHYSSGMFVRLGFAIAVMSRPEILLVDEVLAVGDLNFQKKCYDYLMTLKRDGASIILVSHAPGAIWSLCDSGVLLHKGKLMLDGSVEDLIRQYDDMNSATHDSGPQKLAANYSGVRGGTGDACIQEVYIFGQTGANPSHALEFGEPFVIEAILDVYTSLESPIIRFTLDAAHYRFISSLDSQERNLVLPRLEAGRYRVLISVDAPNLMPGFYKINASISRKGVPSHLFFWTGAQSFQVRHSKTHFFYSEPSAVLFLSGTMEIEPVEGSRPSLAETSL
jgi:lipopolysaccharide transport system ATP-binding protein